MLPKIVVIAGPYGAGQEELVEQLLIFPDVFKLAVSHTTRPPRPDEVPGERYTFVDPQSFAAHVLCGDYAEHAQIGRSWYATPWEEINRTLGEREILLLSVSVMGALAIRSACTSEAHLVFVAPEKPWEEHLRLRLLERLKNKSISEEEMNRMWCVAHQEMKLKDFFDRTVVLKEDEGTFADSFFSQLETL